MAQKKRIVRVRGINEPLPGRTLLHGVTDLLDPNAYEFIDLEWSAQYGPAGAKGIIGEDYETALREGVAKLRALLDEAPAIVIGYSGGAHLLHIVAWAGHHNLLAAGFIADPAMPADITKVGWGITGEIRPISRSLPTRWIYNTGDIICCAPADSPLRTISDATGKFGVLNFGNWGWDLIDRLVTMRWQVLFKYIFQGPLAMRDRVNLAIDGAIGYLDGSDHVAAYVGARQHELARWIETVA